MVPKRSNPQKRANMDRQARYPQCNKFPNNFSIVFRDNVENGLKEVQ